MVATPACNVGYELSARLSRITVLVSHATRAGSVHLQDRPDHLPNPTIGAELAVYRSGFCDFQVASILIRTWQPRLGRRRTLSSRFLKRSTSRRQRTFRIPVTDTGCRPYHASRRIILPANVRKSIRRFQHDVNIPDRSYFSRRTYRCRFSDDADLRRPAYTRLR